MHSPLPKLSSIAREILFYLSNLPPEKRGELPTLEDYHGFAKARFWSGPIEKIVAEHGLTLSEVQVELVEVTRDLSDEIHRHLASDAVVVVLGEGTHFTPPTGALAFLKGEWRPVAEGAEILIPAGLAHGFTVTEGHRFFFLSVQTPPIVKENGEDDYVNVKDETARNRA